MTGTKRVSQEFQAYIKTILSYGHLPFHGGSAWA